MIDDRQFRDKGKFKKGHPGYNKPQHPPPDSPSDTDTYSDFDAAIIAAATSFGTAKKPKVGLAGYCASLRDTRPQDFAALVTKALARKSIASTVATTGITSIEFVTAPAGMFLPAKAARAEWGRRTGFQLSDEPPQLVVDNTDDNTFTDDDDDAS